MLSFREMISALEGQGELLRVHEPVEARFELPGLLQQAEERGNAIIFENVIGSDIPVAGGLLTTPARFGVALGCDADEPLTRARHAELTAQAVRNPVTADLVKAAPSQEAEGGAAGAAVDVQRLPVPTCFEGDSGPFMTAAVGVSRNPDNGVLNAGFYRVLVTGPNEVVVSVGPGSDLRRFLAADKAAGRNTDIALVIGGDPALLMAAAAKVPPEISELDVAGGYTGRPLEVVSAQHSNLLVPARAEIVVEVSVDHARYIDNTMGEFGDLYGTQVGQVAAVQAITHRADPIFHTIMAGAGREHNSIGLIVLYGLEAQLRDELAAVQPGVGKLAALFRPPEMGTTGEIYMQLAPNVEGDPAVLARKVFNLRCGNFDIARMFHLIVIVDEDVDVHNKSDVMWAINNRANALGRHQAVEGLDKAGGGLRRVIDARIGARDAEALRRLVIPGLNESKLDDYL